MFDQRLLSFDWDVQKAASNVDKHGIEFWHAAEIFDDPNVHSTYDHLHSDREDRYISIGLDYTGVCLLVIHTFNELSESKATVRMISARPPTKRETETYWKERTQ